MGGGVSRARRAAAIAAAAALLPLVPPPAHAGRITLRALATGFSRPAGIDHHEAMGRVVTSANHPSGLPHVFETIAEDGTRERFSDATGFTEEIKIATVRSGPCQGGFTVGELFSGSGTPGEIVRISPDGSRIDRPWVTLPGESGLLRGGLFQDRYCAVGGDLVVVTKAGNVWRVTSAGVPTKVATITVLGTVVPLEGVTTTPADAARYGPWSGRILAGAEDVGCVYAIDAAGSYACTKLPKPPTWTPDDPIRPEDIDVVLADANFYGVDYAGGTIWGAEAAQFTDMVGDLVIPQEYGAFLYRVRWNGTAFDVEELAQASHWEHVTFSPAGVSPIPPACPVADITVAIDRPVPGRLYLEDVDSGPSGIAEAVVRGATLTVRATSSDPSNTSTVRFLLDGSLKGSDPTAPYAFVVGTEVAPGTHTLRVEAQQADRPACVATVTMPIVVAEPGVKAVAKALYSAANVPAEPIVHAGGAQAGTPSGAATTRILDQSVPSLASVHAATDRAQTHSVPALHAEAESLIEDTSILGGLVTAEVLHAKVRADYDAGAGVASASDDGSLIAGLRVGGVEVRARQPNMTIEIPGGLGRVVIEETLVTGSGARREIEVNMIHAFLDTPSLKAEVIVGSAFAGVSFLSNTFAGPETDLIHRADDAGSGADAGPTAAGAVAIGEGVWSGALHPGDDADTFSFGARQGVRILAALRPSERETVWEEPIAPGPPPPEQALSYAADAAGSTHASGPDLPNFDLFLYDPSGILRAQSTQTWPFADRVELNADLPYGPPELPGTWTLRVGRATASPDGFYALSLALPPNPLLAQNDGAFPGDAGDTCAAGRFVPTGATTLAADVYALPGVIRDADPADHFWVSVRAGQLVTVALKPDEGADGANFDLHVYGPTAPGGTPFCAAPIAGSTNGALAKAQPESIAFSALTPGAYGVEVRRVNAVANYYLEVTVAK